ncbi:hypothetical protein EON63_21090 [archaeon]|nr:MAG: hypothetical protein EON63_21090 [archaeon]
MERWEREVLEWQRGIHEKIDAYTAGLGKSTYTYTYIYKHVLRAILSIHTIHTTNIYTSLPPYPP